MYGDTHITVTPEVESDWEKDERRMGTGNCEKLLLIIIFLRVLSIFTF